MYYGNYAHIIMYIATPTAFLKVFTLTCVHRYMHMYNYVYTYMCECYVTSYYIYSHHVRILPAVE